MKRTLLLRATVPAVVIGLLVGVSCLVSAWYINCPRLMVVPPPSTFAAIGW